MQRLAVTAIVFVLSVSVMAQQSAPSPSKAEARPRGAESTVAVTPPGYLIGPEDVLAPDPRDPLRRGRGERRRGYRRSRFRSSGSRL